MARPWIEFVQSQALPWQPDDLGGLRPGLEVKRLSMDADTGACSLLLRYPAGWKAPAQMLSVDEEVLVLDGALEVGGARFTAKHYGHWPAGYAPGDMASPEGATVLAFFSATPKIAPQPTGYDETRLVRHIDAFSVPYTGNFHPEFPPGAGRKMLFKDPVTGDQSWILGTLPMRWAERAEVHPVVEEMYLLSGEVHGNRGVMRPGAYFWRPPDLPHGPYGTLTGNLYFFRTKGGGLSTTYQDAEKPFQWWPAYDPVLPESLAAAAKEQPSSPPPW
jgi:hypothetical protein